TQMPMPAYRPTSRLRPAHGRNGPLAPQFIEPGLPLGHRHRIRSPMVGVACRDGFDGIVPAAHALLIDHRQTGQAGWDDLVGLAIIVAHRHPYDAAVRLRL